MPEGRLAHVRLNRNTWSARSSGSPWLKLISSWAGPLSWLMVSTSSSAAFAVVVDVLDDGVELVGSVDAVGLPHLFRPAAGAHRRFERIVRIKILLDQVELQFRRYHWLPALLGIKLQDVLEHEARRYVDRLVIKIERIANHLGGRVDMPRHQLHGSISGTR